MLLVVLQVNFDADENYWLGVRDALRMVDSFIEWSKRHPDRAKPLEQFVGDALIASAKRCKSCLSHALGISFAVSKTDEEERISTRPQVDFFEDAQSMIESSPLADTLRNPDDLYGTGSVEEPPSPPAPDIRESGSLHTTEQEHAPSFEMTPTAATSAGSPPSIEFAPSDDEPRIETETGAEFHEAGPIEISPLDSLERRGSMSEEDISPEGAPRDFGDAFHLDEPAPLSVSEPHETSTEVPDAVGKMDYASTETTPADASSFSEDVAPPIDESFEDTIAEIDRVLDEALATMATPEEELSRVLGEDGASTLRDSEESKMEAGEPPMMGSEEELSPTSTEPHEAPLEEPMVTPPPEGLTEGVREEPLVTPPPVTDTSAEDTVSTPTAPEDLESEMGDIEPASPPQSEEPSEARKPWSSSHDRPRTWTPYDEPSLPHEDELESSDESDYASDESQTPAQTPPPPPPPEPDESEEERQKRTRRLFFGA